MALGCADIRVLLSSVEQAQRLSPALLPVHGSAHGGIYMLAMGLAPPPSDNIFRADSVRALGCAHRRLHRHTHRTRHRRHLPRPPCRRQRRHATRPCHDETHAAQRRPHGTAAAHGPLRRMDDAPQASASRGAVHGVGTVRAGDSVADGTRRCLSARRDEHEVTATLRRDNKPEVPWRTRLLVHQFADDALLRRQLLP